MLISHRYHRLMSRYDWFTIESVGSSLCLLRIDVGVLMWQIGIRGSQERRFIRVDLTFER